MRAGDLRERITIQRLQTWQGKFGPESAWRDFAKTRASVTPTTATERASDKGIDSSARFTVKLRYRPGITSVDQFVWLGKVLDVVSVVDPTGRRRELVCECVHNGDGKPAA